ncbi:hypothetical protein CJJ23_02275 [Mycoplasmopsis agassizii]|uniref:Lipoprotein associated domain-containing protein n=1 Tax=Mycoplasmopsis agassizii TaxID=33922 RepID=A0A269TIS0_9BACT|nr:hypothetical protein [Mycoplasmopsis agassizii]PAK21344.1 hypothetical protein CJJ23_02275 [Mycoplasmopsis agassizii]
MKKIKFLLPLAGIMSVSVAAVAISCGQTDPKRSDLTIIADIKVSVDNKTVTAKGDKTAAEFVAAINGISATQSITQKIDSVSALLNDATKAQFNSDLKTALNTSGVTVALNAAVDSTNANQVKVTLSFQLNDAKDSAVVTVNGLKVSTDETASQKANRELTAIKAALANVTLTAASNQTANKFLTDFNAAADNSAKLAVLKAASTANANLTTFETELAKATVVSLTATMSGNNVVISTVINKENATAEVADRTISTTVSGFAAETDPEVIDKQLLDLKNELTGVALSYNSGLEVNTTATIFKTTLETKTTTAEKLEYLKSVVLQNDNYTKVTTAFDSVTVSSIEATVDGTTVKLSTTITRDNATTPQTVETLINNFPTEANKTEVDVELEAKVTKLDALDLTYAKGGTTNYTVATLVADNTLTLEKLRSLLSSESQALLTPELADLELGANLTLKAVEGNNTEVTASFTINKEGSTSAKTVSLKIKGLYTTEELGAISSEQDAKLKEIVDALKDKTLTYDKDRATKFTATTFAATPNPNIDFIYEFVTNETEIKAKLDEATSVSIVLKVEEQTTSDSSASAGTTGGADTGTNSTGSTDGATTGNTEGSGDATTGSEGGTTAGNADGSDAGTTGSGDTTSGSTAGSEGDGTSSGTGSGDGSTSSTTPQEETPAVTTTTVKVVKATVTVNLVGASNTQDVELTITGFYTDDEIETLKKENQEFAAKVQLTEAIISKLTTEQASLKAATDQGTTLKSKENTSIAEINDAMKDKSSMDEFKAQLPEDQASVIDAILAKFDIENSVKTVTFESLLPSGPGTSGLTTGLLNLKVSYKQKEDDANSFYETIIQIKVTELTAK